MAEAKRKLATILNADVAGYSRLMGDNERATVRTLTDYREVFRDHIARHAGRVVDAPGDNLLAEFASPVEAVECALEVQRELAQRNQDLTAHRRMEFRIGLNLGDVIEQDGALFGDGVNIAARLEALATPGGLCLSDTVHHHVRKLDLDFEDLGAQQVKNIAEPVRAYRVNLNGGQSEPTPDESKAPDDATLSLPTGPSIAVLPFTNMGGDPEQEFFSDGITEQIITDLTRFPDLFVIARNTTFQYKDRSVDVPEVGRELGVQFVLEGSVRRGGDRLRITAQLIDAQTGGHVWAETYDRNLSASDLFDIQDEITAQVVASIADTYGAISRAIHEKVKDKNVNDLEAYEWILAAHQHYAGVGTSLEQLARIRVGLEGAVKRNPNYADAWAWLAATYRDTHAFDSEALPNALDKAEEAARQALKLDPSNQQGHLALAHIYFFRHDLTAFYVEAERTLSINPNSADALGAMGFSMAWAGKWDRAMALLEKAMLLNPNFPNWFYHPIAVNHMREGRHEDALATLHKGDWDPNNFWTHFWYAAILGHLGKLDDARVAVEKLRAIFPDIAECAHVEFHRFNLTDELIGKALDGLRKAGLDIPNEPVTGNRR